MESLHFDDQCPKCHFHRMTEWSDMNDEQKMLIELLPTWSEFTAAEREKHRFCGRCMYVEHQPNTTAA